jgi:hypothetical protein
LIFAQIEWRLEVVRHCGLDLDKVIRLFAPPRLIEVSLVNENSGENPGIVAIEDIGGLRVAPRLESGVSWMGLDIMSDGTLPIRVAKVGQPGAEGGKKLEYLPNASQRKGHQESEIDNQSDSRKALRPPRSFAGTRPDHR